MTIILSKPKKKHAAPYYKIFGIQPLPMGGMSVGRRRIG